ncbi:MAG: glycosyltransferase [Candidatus Sericytochromatia bacterium]|nr:glycosyltransferase [Candidatus Tanganyikabacteria bacterium]
MTRIALISVHGDPSADIGAEGAGGQNVYVREVARNLARRGLEIDVFTRSQAGELVRERALFPGVRLVSVPCGPEGYVPRDALFAELPEFVRHAADWVKRHGVRYRALHSNYWLSGWVGMRLAGLWKTPQTHTFHSLGRVKYAALGAAIPHRGRIRLGVEEAIASTATALVATTQDEAEKLRHSYQASAPIALIPCGFDAERFRPLDRAQCRQDLGLPADAPILLYVGRFVKEKGVETLIRAAAVLRLEHPVHLVLVGGYQEGGADEAEYRRVRDLISALGLGPATTFAGAVDHGGLAAYYAAADVTVVPSHYEAFGMVAIEAMACGCPVVASAAGGLAANILDGRTGLLATPRDVPAFTHAIARVLAVPGLARKLARSALVRAHREFDWARVALCLDRHYASLQPAGV